MANDSNVELKHVNSFKMSAIEYKDDNAYLRQALSAQHQTDGRKRSLSNKNKCGATDNGGYNHDNKSYISSNSQLKY